MSKLVFALPSKGRLQEQMLSFLADSGMHVSQGGGERFYGASIPSLPDAEVRLMASSEIAAALKAGDVHLGVTGEDLIREADLNLKSIALVRPLGFGKADLVVAVPQSWIDVTRMADLEAVCAEFHARTGRRLRVATKYLVQSHAFFDKHGVDDYRLIESAGATEGAPASGTAEVIVDITTSGQTLADNYLRPLTDGVITKSQAQLAASRSAPWSDGVKATLRRLLDMIEARARAKSVRVLRVKGGKPDELLSCARKFGGAPAGEGADLHCPAERVIEACAALRQAGAEDVAVIEPTFLFAQQNEIYDRFIRVLGGEG